MLVSKRMHMLKTGIKGIEIFKVSDKNTAKSMNSGTLTVLSTPFLIAKMEECAWKSVQPYLEQEKTTVGCYIEVKHLSPTSIGMKVKCTGTLTKINDKELLFELTAHDEHGLIAEGLHKRVIVHTDRFLNKAYAKRND